MSRNIFNTVQMTRPGRSTFDLSHDVKMTGNPNRLIPTLALECVPGDVMHLACESLLRFQPLIAPIMHRTDVTMHYFFVPNRLVWDNWDKFISNQKDPTLVPAHPFIETGPVALSPNMAYSRLMDYMGIPDPEASLNPVYPAWAQNENISALPFAAYQMIYNEYYRDENLVPEVDFQLTDGDNSANAALNILRFRAWRPDYFTKALPFAQKGDPVQIPIELPPVPIASNTADTGPSIWNVTDAGGVYAANVHNAEILPTPGDIPPDYLYAQTDTIEGAETNVTDLRTAIQIQSWLEKLARSGTRFKEFLEGVFGVRSQDYRLQRPEYITGTKSPVSISTTFATATTTEAPQGNMSGNAVSTTNGGYGKYFCHEHGWIIGIMSVMPVPAYQQGIERSFKKINDPFQYFFPDFEHIGEQEVKVHEIFAGTANSEDTFGYDPRYAEYKYKPARVAGQMRTSLAHWHWGRIFSAEPTLTQAFIESSPDNRIFAVEDEDVDKLIMHVMHKIRATRPMSFYGSPHI